MAIDQGKKPVLGVGISVIDYAGAVGRIIKAAQNRQPLKVTALAVHGVMTGALDPNQRWRLNQFDLVAPDGQPVRWAVNLLHKSKLEERVYGPDLTLEVCSAAALANLPVYLYGSRAEVLEKLSSNLQQRFPGLIIAGKRASLFRPSTQEEKSQIIGEIRDSGAAVVFVGLGCPRQETWVYEYADQLSIPALAVGAAFDFHAGLLPQAPKTLQRYGLEWFYRLCCEPRRLWRRYVLLNPLFVIMLFLQWSKLRRYTDAGRQPHRNENFA